MSTRTIVALGLLRFSPGRTEVEIVPLNAAGRADPVAAARAYVQRGTPIVAALSRHLIAEELAAYVPGVARCPDVEWIAAEKGDEPS